MVMFRLVLSFLQNLLPEDFQYKAEFLMLLLKVHAENSPSILQVQYDVKVTLKVSLILCKTKDCLYLLVWLHFVILRH